MTSYSSPTVHPCPGCDVFFLRRHLRTANFYRTQDWSDAKPTMFWRQEPLVRCDACAALFWLDDIDDVGILPANPKAMGRLERLWSYFRGDRQGRLREHEDWASLPGAWKSATYIGRANFDDVAYVLARSESVTRDQLLWLRQRVWWGLNDRYRRAPDGSALPDVPSWPEADERGNMEAILDMLKDGECSGRSMIQQGELLRLLGRFDEAVAVLKAVPADGHSEVRALKIERLALRGDTHVRELSAPAC